MWDIRFCANMGEISLVYSPPINAQHGSHLLSLPPVRTRTVAADSVRFRDRYRLRTAGLDVQAVCTRTGSAQEERLEALAISRRIEPAATG